jgi:hypothetical protein
MCLIGKPYVKAYAVYERGDERWDLLWLFSTDERRNLWLINQKEPELRELAGSIGRDKYNSAQNAKYRIEDYSLDYPLRCH